MNYHFVLGVLAGSCSVVAITYYVSSILRKETKPNRASWIIWNITNIILLASYFSVGARATIFLPAVYVINGLVVFGLTFRYGVSSWSRLDFMTLIVAGISLLTWFITKNPLLAMLMVLVMDSVGYLPTIKKIIIDPFSESRTAWTFILLGSFFNILAIGSLSFGIIIYPVIIFTMNAVVIITFYFRKEITSQT